MHYSFPPQIDQVRVVVYCLYGYLDTPDDFLQRQA
ncbi:MAG: hypothetical protein DDT26_00579 [Dehalococcoidia bacterium]|nr:hypothetical protein [Chloroflexota bacterium]